jgi:hypothetical protein
VTTGVKVICIVMLTWSAISLMNTGARIGAPCFHFWWVAGQGRLACKPRLWNHLLGNRSQPRQNARESDRPWQGAHGHDDHLHLPGRSAGPVHTSAARPQPSQHTKVVMT